jgi:hypothetical protein
MLSFSTGGSLQKQPADVVVQGEEHEQAEQAHSDLLADLLDMLGYGTASQKFREIIQ